MIEDNLLKEISWQSYRDVHGPEARARIIENHGEDFFKSRGHYHMPILQAAFKLLEAQGYAIVPRCQLDTVDGPDLDDDDLSDLC
jgi:hypothetical protein